MLVLSRKKDEAILIGDDIEIIITEVSEDRVKIGIKAPKNYKIFRKELLEQIKDENIRLAGEKVDINKLDILNKK